MTSFRRGDRDRLQASPGRSFIEGVSWPVSAAALSALVDMGMSDDRIARYFGVETAEVSSRRERLSVPAHPVECGRAGVGSGHEGGVAPGQVAG